MLKLLLVPPVIMKESSGAQQISLYDAVALDNLISGSNMDLANGAGKKDGRNPAGVNNSGVNPWNWVAKILNQLYHRSFVMIITLWLEVKMARLAWLGLLIGQSHSV